MAGKKLFGGLVDGMTVLKVILIGLATLLVGVIIYGLIIGTLNYAVQNNNIPVSDAIKADVNDTEADYITYKDLIIDNLGLIIGLVALVVIIAVLGFFLWDSKKKGGSDVADF